MPIGLGMLPLLGSFGAGGASRRGSSENSLNADGPETITIPSAGNRAAQTMTVEEAGLRRDELARMAQEYPEGSTIRAAMLDQRDRIDAALAARQASQPAASAQEAVSAPPSPAPAPAPRVTPDGLYADTYFSRGQPASGQFEDYRSAYPALDDRQWTLVTSLLDQMNLTPDTRLYRGAPGQFLVRTPDGGVATGGAPEPSGALISTLNPPPGRSFSNDERTFLPLFTARINEQGSGTGPYLSARQGGPGIFLTPDRSIAENYGFNNGADDQVVISTTVGDLLAEGFMPFKDRDVESAIFFQIPQGRFAPVDILGGPGMEGRVDDRAGSPPAPDSQSSDDISKIIRDNRMLFRRPEGELGPFRLGNADAVTRGAAASPALAALSSALTDPQTGESRQYKSMSEASSALAYALRVAQLAEPSISLGEAEGGRIVSLAEQELGLALLEIRDPATGSVRVTPARTADTGIAVLPGKSDSIQFGDIVQTLDETRIQTAYGGGELARVRFVHTHPIVSTLTPGDPNVSLADMRFAADRSIRITNRFGREVPVEMASADILSGVVINIHADRPFSSVRYSIESLTEGAPLPYAVRIDRALVRTAGMPGAENQTIQSRESYVQNVTERMTWLIRATEAGAGVSDADIRAAAEAQADSALASVDDLPADLTDAMQILDRDRTQ